jgi:hypothetical protein
MTRRFSLKPVYFLAVAAALCFGSTQAVAGPVQKTARTCQGECNDACVQAGYDYGLCRSNGVCLCYYHMCGDYQC